MQPDEIRSGDMVRILMGDLPPAFLIEVIIRIFLLYILLVISVRMLGRRVPSSSGVKNLPVLVLLAAAIGIPMQDPGNGLIPAFIIAAIVVLTLRLMNIIPFKSRKLERITQGSISVLINDGVIDLDKLKKTGVSQEKIFARLRSEGIDNLGRIQRLYVEPDGNFSLIIKDYSIPGLSIIPLWDTDYRNGQPHEADMRSCTSCGYTARTSGTYKGCPRCNSITWETAVI